ncbi:MAG TPA: hypothetical protein DCQ39_00070 [Lachnospiraceae bacterium]|nr:hypothetical protein [Lachnospiraceae bacterium]
MLNRLLKYDMKSYSRVLLPLYGAILAVAAANGLAWRVSDVTGGSVLAGLLTTAYIILMFAAVILTVLTVLLRFYKNLLGREGYLMFALPATVGEHIASKVISAAVWVVIGSAAGLLSLPVMMLLSGSIRTEEWNEMMKAMPYLSERLSQYTTGIAWGVIFLILSLIALIVKVYASIALGACANEYRFLWSVGAFILFSITDSFLTTGLAGAGAKINIMQTGSTAVTDSTGFTPFMMGACVYCAVLAGIYWFVTWLCLDRKLNLE